MEIREGFSKQQDYDGGLFDEKFRPYIINPIAKIFVGLQGLLESQHSVFNFDPFFVLKSFITKPAHRM